MQKIESFNRKNLDQVRESLNSKLKELEEFGISFEIGSFRFNENEFHTKLTCKMLNAKKEQEDPKHNWNQLCIFFGLKPEDYKEEFIIRGNAYKFIKFDMKKRKYPVIMQNIITQKKYKMAEYDIKK